MTGGGGTMNGIGLLNKIPVEFFRKQEGYA